MSNIAWLPDADDEVAAMLRGGGATGVEIAPTRYWPDPAAATARELAAVRRAWEDRGLPVVALQSLLFGRPASDLFGSPDERAALLDYLGAIVRVGAALGARPLVFGSPKNRRRGAHSIEEATAIAVSFFRALGDVATAHGVTVAIEPNPPAYGCDFVTNTGEGTALVSEIDHEGVGLHLDAGAVALNGENPAAAVAAAGPWLRHVHCSEAQLAPIGTTGFAHDALADALRAAGYAGWVSIEMRAPEPAAPNGSRDTSHVEASFGVLRASVAAARAAYGDDAR